MRKNHRILALLAACLMTLSIAGITGCGPSSGPAGDPDDSDTGDTGEKVRVTLLYPWSGFLQSSDEATDPNNPFYDERWKLIMDKFNLSIDYIACDSASMADKLRTMIGGGNMPDVALSMNMDAREMHIYAEQGGLKVLPKSTLEPVSYTHLTLPTSDLV